MRSATRAAGAKPASASRGARGADHTLRRYLGLLLLLALALTGGDCNDITSSLGVDWDAFDDARPPIDPVALGVREGDLVAVGRGRSGPQQDVLIWDETRWEFRGGGTGVNESFAVATYDERVVLGGAADEAAGDSMHVVLLDGSQWLPLGGDVDGPVYALAIHQGRLIAGGAFAHAGGDSIPHLAAFDGTWHAIGGGVDGAVHVLHAEGGALYVAGDFVNAGGVAAAGIARIAGDTFEPLGSPPVGTIRAITVWNEAPVIGGAFRRLSGSDSAISVWAYDGTDWTPVGELALEEGVNALTVYEEDLVAGGLTGAYRRDGSAWRHIHSSAGGTRALVVYRETLIFADARAGTAATITRYED